jgi:hypothetical protein
MKIKGIALAVASVFATSPLYADIFDALPNDLVIPNIYNTKAADIINVQLKLVISDGNCEISSDGVEDYTGCTLEDVNRKDKFKPEVKVHFQASDFPDDNSVSNATLRQRGGSTRFAPQKSYRIKLDSKKKLWRGERKLQVNKNPWDLVRIRNKLSFDIMKNIPYLPSLDSQFPESVRVRFLHNA